MPNLSLANICLSVIPSVCNVVLRLPRSYRLGHFETNSTDN